MTVPNVKLHDGKDIPQVGLGLWQVKSMGVFSQAFQTAVGAGYRHFDTAQVYGNEAYLGKVWRSSGIGRKDLFITTKIRVENITIARTAASFRKSLENLQTDYVDLLLLHFPVTLARKKAWKELEKIHAEGVAKSIGVSNYTVKHLEEMKQYATEMPAVNQVELHVFLQQPELLDYCKREGIVVEAYSPLAHAADMSDLTVQAVAKKHDKTYAQVMLRWLIQQGMIVLPKSVTPERIRENIDVFGFELDDEDMLRLSKLDRGERTCWDPTHVP